MNFAVDVGGNHQFRPIPPYLIKSHLSVGRPTRRIDVGRRITRGRTHGWKMKRGGGHHLCRTYTRHTRETCACDPTDSDTYPHTDARATIMPRPVRGARSQWRIRILAVRIFLIFFVFTVHLYGGYVNRAPSTIATGSTFRGFNPHVFVLSPNFAFVSHSDQRVISRS